MTTSDSVTVRFEHARAVVTVVGEPGTSRLVTVQPHQADLRIQRSPCRTRYPDALIARLLEVKGPEYVCDEIARDEDPSYAEINIDLGLFSYLRADEFAGKRLLDFGCGCGSSTMILARRLPATTIVGVELVPESLEVARLRARHYGRDDIVFRASPDGNTLPADLGQVDFIVMNAVFEHLLPAERRPVMAQLWSALRPGGVLFMQETPNRWCPVEMHTTGLPLLNYAGDGLAHRLARRYSRRVAPAGTWEGLLRDGIRGGSVREIRGTLPASQGRPELLRPIVPGLAGQADLWYRASARRHGASTPKNVVRVCLKAARALTTLDFTPELILAVRKRGAGPVAQ
jgi:2-polyprenyl-3-methyl-5-hydroxy-6-metoxy-1,4-benzoquinol methylase